jgi:peptidoglycan/xylan/chitin deacetylase (PgdA/CDA1 family)
MCKNSSMFVHIVRSFSRSNEGTSFFLYLDTLLFISSGSIPLRRGKVFMTTSWDDGHPLDLKLCSLLKEYGMSATMYIPIANPENKIISSDTIRAIAKDFEIGGHTYNHTRLTQADENKMMYELTESKNVLESIVRKEVVSFCYPWGLYNKKVTEKVKKSGYKLARTAKSLRTTLSRPLEYHPTIHAFDYNLIAKSKFIVTTSDRSLAAKLLLYGNIFKRWEMIAKKSLDDVLENGGIWHLWGHSWEIDRYDNWPLLRDVLEYAKVNGRKYGADFVTNGMLVGY